jgi:ferredoxin
MKRTIIKINPDLCNGCGLCVKGCHEGALQLINGKAELVSALHCDGLGACIGDCPEGAITLEEREAEAYDEIAVMKNLLPKGMDVIKAHFKHLYDHSQADLLAEGIAYMESEGLEVPDYKDKPKVKHSGCPGSAARSFAPAGMPQASGGGCPGTAARSFTAAPDTGDSCSTVAPSASALTQWPVQLHLLNPSAPYFNNADLLIASDCSAFACGNFHSHYLKGKKLAIACPKLDSGLDSYREKITAMIDMGGINTITVLIMEVPCCGGLMRIAKEARDNAQRHIPVKIIKIGMQGNEIENYWL